MSREICTWIGRHSNVFEGNELFDLFVFGQKHGSSGSYLPNLVFDIFLPSVALLAVKIELLFE